HCADKTGDEQTGKEHEQTAQGQQEELLDDEPAAIAFLRLEEKLHRRPADALVAHAVDEVDDDGRADEGGAGDHEPRVEKPGEHKLSCEPACGLISPSILPSRPGASRRTGRPLRTPSRSIVCRRWSSR